MTIQLLIEQDIFDTRSAILKNGILTDYLVEANHDRSIVDQIYFGRVSRFADNMDAAFVELGSSRGGLLLSRNAPALNSDGPGTTIRHKLQEGERLPLQIIKDAKDGKPAEVSAFLHLDGAYVTLKPNGQGIQFPKQMSDNDLKSDINKQLQPMPGQWVVRSHAIDKPVELICNDARKLAKTWQEIQQKQERLSKASLLFEPTPKSLLLALRQSKDALSLISNNRAILKNCEAAAPSDALTFEHWSNLKSLFSQFDLDDQISEIFEKRLEINGGGNITIEETEALVAIDVNSSGGSVVSDPKRSALDTNLRAANLISQQIRLRNLSGIIIVDFIQMAGKRDIEELISTMKSLTANDPVTVRILSMTELGLLQITRKRERPPISSTLAMPIICKGKSIPLKRASQLTQDLKNFASAHKTALISVQSGAELEALYEAHKSSLESDLSIKLNWSASDRMTAFDFEIRDSRKQVTHPND